MEKRTQKVRPQQRDTIAEIATNNNKQLVITNQAVHPFGLNTLLAAPFQRGKRQSSNGEDMSTAVIKLAP